VRPGETPITLLGPLKLGALFAVGALGCSLVSLVVNPALNKCSLQPTSKSSIKCHYAVVTHYLLIIITVYVLAHAVCIHPYPTYLPGETGKRQLGIGGHVLVSGCPEHWTIQP